MLTRSGNRIRILCLCAVLLASAIGSALSTASWSGVLNDVAGTPVGRAVISLHAVGGRDYVATTTADGKFAFAGIVAGDYAVSVTSGGNVWKAATLLVVKEDASLSIDLRFSGTRQELRFVTQPNPQAVTPVIAPSVTPATTPSPAPPVAAKGETSTQASGGEHLSSTE